MDATIVAVWPFSDIAVRATAGESTNDGGGSEASDCALLVKSESAQRVELHPLFGYGNREIEQHLRISLCQRIYP
jgi:hypothetical protein